MRSFPGMKQVPFEDRGVFNLLFLLEHYLPKNAALQAMKQERRARVAARLRSTGRGRVLPVERVRDISPEEFRARYLSRGMPVVLEGAAAEWPLMRRWGFDAFRERFGHERVKLVQRKGLSDDDFVDEREFSEEIVFGEFLDQALHGGRKYMRFSPLLERFPQLLDDFDQRFFREMTGNGLGITYQLFIGGAGTFTPLHNAMTSFLFVNVCGVKRWSLIPCRYLSVLDPAADGFGYNHSGAEGDLSNADEFPGLESIDRLEAVMQPGDVLFNPSWMWHSVKNEAPTIGVRCGFIDPKGMLLESPTLTFIRLFAARNPSTLEALYLTFFKKNLPDRDKWLLTPRFIRR